MPRSRSTTRVGTLLKKQIPIRTFQGWNDAQPGFLEIDLVAHCGTLYEGSYLSTLTLTDVATGWTECLPLLHRGQALVIQALDRARQLLPFPMLGLDTDNGGEFINAELLAYCEREHITFTRGRTHKSTDQCYVEQKNGAIVRQVVGYDRFSGEAALRQLVELYRALRLYVNIFQPSMKLQSKRREGSHVHRKYDTAQTPLQRLRTAGVLDGEQLHALEQVAHILDPLQLLSQLERLQKALWRHAILPTAQPQHVPTHATLRFSLEHNAPNEPSQGEQVVAQPLPLPKRRHKKYEKSRRPHDWRSRPDPFEGCWEQITVWLIANPERTGVSLFQQVQDLYPGRFRDTQVRTDASRSPEGARPSPTHLRRSRNPGTDQWTAFGPSLTRVGHGVSALSARGRKGTPPQCVVPFLPLDPLHPSSLGLVGALRCDQGPAPGPGFGAQLLRLPGLLPHAVHMVKCFVRQESLPGKILS